MYDRETTCCFTGHRPWGLPWGTNENDPRCLKMKFELSARLEGLIQGGYRHFLCGMALGCDLYFAEAVLDLRRQYPDLTLEAAVPCANQTEKWSGAQRRRYEEILKQCDTVTVLQEAYTRDCMMRRNRYMVDRSSVLLAAYAGTPGGTQNTILYARRQGVIDILIEI